MKKMKVMETALRFAQASIKEIDHLEDLLAITMTMLDEWAIAHNISPEELEDAMVESIEVMRNCHKSLGW